MDHMNVQHPAIDQMVAHHPRDPLVIQGRLEACTASLKVVENHVYGRKKKMRKLNQSLKILMSDCLLMFTTLATDYGVEVAAATEALDLIELLALPMLSTGRREHRPERLFDSLSGITAAYLTQLQALYATVEEEARAAASAQLVVDRLQRRRR